MSWLLGAGMGLMMGGPLGAVVGGVLQHMVTQKVGDQTMSTGSGTSGETVFITNLAAIMTKVAMADGYISAEERSIMHNFFAGHLAYTGEELRFIDGIISQTERYNPDLRQVCQEFRKFATPEMRMLLLDLTYQIATADQVITDKEQIEIDLIAAQIGISESDHSRIKYKYHASVAKHSDYYQTLGVNKFSSDSEIKKAYRQMASQYHPDKVSHLGEELVKFANRKFTEINEAYSAIKKERRF